MKTKTKTEDRSNDREKRKNWDGWYGTVGYCMPLQDAGRTTIIYSRPSLLLPLLSFSSDVEPKTRQKQSLNPTKIEDPTSFFFGLHSLCNHTCTYNQTSQRQLIIERIKHEI